MEEGRGGGREGGREGGRRALGLGVLRRAGSLQRDYSVPTMVDEVARASMERLTPINGPKM